MYRCSFSGLVRITLVVTGLACAGCASPERRGTDATTTPQEKTRQEQLERMAAEDAARAGVESDRRPQKARPKPVEQRNTGQRISDQPPAR